jgi:hypothetical protein
MSTVRYEPMLVILFWCGPTSVAAIRRFEDVGVPAVTVTGDPAFERPCTHQRKTRLVLTTGRACIQGDSPLLASDGTDIGHVESSRTPTNHPHR